MAVGMIDCLVIGLSAMALMICLVHILLTKSLVEIGRVTLRSPATMKPNNIHMKKACS